jgi:hypothetical protein
MSGECTRGGAGPTDDAGEEERVRKGWAGWDRQQKEALDGGEEVRHEGRERQNGEG